MPSLKQRLHVWSRIGVLLLLTPIKLPYPKFWAYTRSLLFHSAAFSGDITALRFLTWLGAKVDVRSAILGSTPLAAAAVRGRTEAVRWLLNAGADVNAEDFGHTTPLMLAAGEGHAYTVQVLLQAKADINRQDQRGFPAITFAAGSGSVDTLCALANAGADINAAGRKITALRWARLLGQQKSVNWLQQSGGIE